MSYDITEHKRYEELLQAGSREFRQIADNFPGVIFQFIARPDGAYEFAYINEVGRVLTGIDAELQESTPPCWRGSARRTGRDSANRLSAPCAPQAGGSRGPADEAGLRTGLDSGPGRSATAGRGAAVPGADARRDGAPRGRTGAATPSAAARDGNGRHFRRHLGVQSRLRDDLLQPALVRDARLCRPGPADEHRDVEIALPPRRPRTQRRADRRGGSRCAAPGPRGRVPDAGEERRVALDSRPRQRRRTRRDRASDTAQRHHLRHHRTEAGRRAPAVSLRHSGAHLGLRGHGESRWPSGVSESRGIPPARMGPAGRPGGTPDQGCVRGGGLRPRL